MFVKSLYLFFEKYSSSSTTVVSTIDEAIDDLSDEKDIVTQSSELNVVIIYQLQAISPESILNIKN